MASMTDVESRLLGKVIRASKDFKMIEPNDRIMVCMSGGKDSYAMLHLMRLVQKRVPFSFEMIAVNLDQGHPGFPGHVLENYFREQGDEFKMLKRNTYAIVLEKIPEGKTYCSLCSRLRRGILYSAAVELGCTKIALGHHQDDIIETLMLNLLYSGQLKAMPPRLRSDDGRNTVIRPLSYCSEDALRELSEQQQFPIIPCDLCGSQENLQRQQVKRMITDLNTANPNVRGSMFAALRNVRPSHLLDASLREAMGLDGITGEDVSLVKLG
ncbi:MAG: tRNA 2-thiocytidine biosynthesis protein TtcA [Myxococcota bacterium]|jgi:tRNA 2-thiocytidine biosynthesis protein TtcA